MISAYNLFLHHFTRLFVNVIKFKKKALYFKLISKLSIGSYIYSFDKLKIYKSNFEDITFKYTVSGLYMGSFQKKIEQYKNKFYFLDIGSNIGYFSLIAGKNNNCKKVFSIEPSPIIGKFLKKNLNENLRISKYEIYKLAISKVKGELKFYVNNKDSGSSSLIKKKNTNFIKVKSSNYKLFNQIFSKTDKESKIFVKIDTEGKDIEVLNELKKSKIFKNIYCIYIEIENKKDKILNVKSILNKFSYIKRHSITENSKSNKQINMEFARKYSIS
jgi:FkbM family methyltransferase